MKLKKCLIAWNPKSGQVGVSLCSEGHWRLPREEYPMSSGAAWTVTKWMNKDEIIQKVLAEFWHIVIMYDLNPKDVHQAFLQIDEYRKLDAEGMKSLIAPELSEKHRQRQRNYQERKNQKKQLRLKMQSCADAENEV